MGTDLGVYFARETAKYVRNATNTNNATKVQGARGGFGRENPKAFEFDEMNPSGRLPVYGGVVLNFALEDKTMKVSLETLTDNEDQQRLLDAVIKRLELYQVGTSNAGNRGILPIDQNDLRVVSDAYADDRTVCVRFASKANIRGIMTSDERLFKAAYRAAVAPILKAIQECRVDNR